MTKGANAEEALRRYFLSLGYFAVRGIAFKYKGFDVTDVDLWLYQRSSLITRDRTNVDIKNKKTPQAIERIFWTRGLQQVLGLERAVVATTDRRKETKSFGLQHGVQVIGGEFLNGLMPLFSNASDRLTEEELMHLLDTRSIIKPELVYRKLYVEHQELLLSNLGFNGCNAYLSALKMLFEDYAAANRLSEAALRLIYIFTAYFLISLDYATYHLANDEPALRYETMLEGFQYGSSGKDRANEIINVALGLVASKTGDDFISNESVALAGKITEQLSRYPVSTLADYFSGKDVSRRLFAAAKSLENYAYSSTVITIGELEVEAKAIIGVLLDFFGVDRKQIL
jgi:hypothetical protein